MPVNPNETILSRATADTITAIESRWWFWGAQLLVAGASSVIAVSMTDEAANAAIGIVVGAVGFTALVFLANLCFFSPRRQRNEARAEWQRLEKTRATREEFLRSRNTLGEIMNEMGFLLFDDGVSDEDFPEAYGDIYNRVLELLREEGSVVFDESHVGRFFAVTADAQAQGESRGMEQPAIYRHVLRAELQRLDRFIDEINTELNSLPRN